MVLLLISSFLALSLNLALADFLQVSSSPGRTHSLALSLAVSEWADGGEVSENVRAYEQQCSWARICACVHVCMCACMCVSQSVCPSVFV
eukprot:1504609-Pleurochrysis_carterae.AAC.1